MSDNCFIGQRIIKVDDTFWIISTNHNAIWKCNDSFEIVDYLIFEDEVEKDDLFRAIVCIEHVIYCFPFNARNAYAIDTELNTISKISINYCNTSDFSTKEKFSYAFVADNFIICVGRGIYGFLKYDLYNGKTTIVSYSHIFHKKFLCSLSHCIIDGKAYVVSVMEADVVEFDFRNESIKLINLSEFCNKNLSTVMNYNNNIYITNDRHELLKINNECKVMKIFQIKEWKDSAIRASSLEIDRRWFVGNTTGTVLIETNSNKMIFRVEDKVESKYGYYFTAVEYYDNKLFLQLRKNGKVMCINFDENKMYYINISIKPELMTSYKFDIFRLVSNNGGLMPESSDINLNDLVLTI